MTDKISDTGKFYTNYRFEYTVENVVVATSSFQEVPSNKKPLINLTMNGILRPSEEKIYEIKMIFEGQVPQKDRLAQSYGTFVLCKSVYNARRIITTAWDKEKSTLSVLIDLRRQKIRPRRPAQFSFSVQIDDTNLPSCSKVKENGIEVTLIREKQVGKTYNFRGQTSNSSCPTGRKDGPFCSGQCTTCLKQYAFCKKSGTSCCNNCKQTSDQKIGGLCT